MPTIKIPKEEMLDLIDSPIEDNVVDNSRWSIIHEVVFEYKGKFYSSSYSVGATEQQDERPFQYDDDEIDCEEVHQVEKVVKVWEPIDKVKKVEVTPCVSTAPSEDEPAY